MFGPAVTCHVPCVGHAVAAWCDRKTSEFGARFDLAISSGMRIPTTNAILRHGQSEREGLAMDGTYVRRICTVKI